MGVLQNEYDKDTIRVPGGMIINFAFQPQAQT